MATGGEGECVSQYDILERIPDNVLLDPLDYLFADHCRQAKMCELLRDIVRLTLSSVPSPHAADAVLQCLEHDVDLHIADEEEDLFPRLKARVDPTDRFSDVLVLMDREHHRDRDLAANVKAGLRALVEKRPLDDPEGFRRAADLFAEIHLSHLSWENVSVLPLARKRLTHDDLKDLGRAMAQRRGVRYPGD